MREARLLLDALRARGIEIQRSGDGLGYEAPAGCFTEADRQNLRTASEDVVALLDGEAAATIADKPVPAYSVAPILTTTQVSWLKADRSGVAPSENLAIGLPVGDGRYETACRMMLNILRAHEVLRYRIFDPVVGADVALNESETFSVERPADVVPVERLAEHVETLCAVPFRIGSDWGLRAQFVEVADGRSILLLVVSHLLIDGGSIAVLTQSANRGCYIVDANAVEARSCSDFARWEHELSRTSVGEAFTRYWARWRQLVPPLLSPSGGGPPRWGIGRSLTAKFLIPEHRLKGIRKRIRRNNATLFTVLLASYAKALATWSGQSRFSLGSIGDLRTRPELASTLGPLLCCDFLEVDLSGDLDDAELLDSIMDEYHHAIRLRPAGAEADPSATFVKLRQSVGAYINYLPNDVRRYTDFRAHNYPDLMPGASCDLAIDGVATMRWPILLRVSTLPAGLLVSFEFSEASGLSTGQCAALVAEYADAWQALTASVP